MKVEDIREVIKIIRESLPEPLHRKVIQETILNFSKSDNCDYMQEIEKADKASHAWLEENIKVPSLSDNAIFPFIKRILSMVKRKITLP